MSNVHKTLYCELVGLTGISKQAMISAQSRFFSVAVWGLLPVFPIISTSFHYPFWGTNTVSTSRARVPLFCLPGTILLNDTYCYGVTVAGHLSGNSVTPFYLCPPPMPLTRAGTG